MRRRSREPTAPPELKQTGLELFRHEWEPNDPQAHCDGLGPVYNARSCVACHSQGGVGGAGDNSHNVTAFEALPTQDRPEIKGGLVHLLTTPEEPEMAAVDIRADDTILSTVTGDHPLFWLEGQEQLGRLRDRIRPRMV